VSIVSASSGGSTIQPSPNGIEATAAATTQLTP
jgi:hypothetical protein